ncbi:hypothetical protein M0805_007980 [Coniferiporia weirii]|nr:hypothetical protein M0805_007980 [Coniferiporia weirii]
MGFKGPIDYSLYLVTGRELIPPGADYYETLEKALEGGVTVVQVREKNTDTGEFLEVARKTKDICHKYNVPIFINDRVDIALAMGADGVHVGQSDMPARIVRQLLPPGTLIGVSANTPADAAAAVADGADYIGIGPIWSTQTKADIKNVLGPRGAGAVLDALQGSDVRAVAIAGINARNTLRTLHGVVSASGRALDGVAVVSAIMASRQPREAAREISTVVRAFLSSAPPIFSTPSAASLQAQGIIHASAALLAKIRETGPLIHQITNAVVVNQSANVTLALGASPIMATAAAEMEDLSKVSGALLVNFGTISDKTGMLEAGRWVNTRRNPIVFDPVAVGATKFRFQAAQELLNTWQASVIKGNPAEIGALARSDEVQSRGVDSVGNGFSDPVPVLKQLARAERCIIAMTGKTDWVTDGELTVSSSNGHELLAHITGSGCIVGTSVATFCAAANLLGKNDTERHLVRGDMLIGAIAGILAITVASELAAAREDVKGTGTFLSALIDELYNLTPEKYIDRARIEIHS